MNRPTVRRIALATAGIVAAVGITVVATPSPALARPNCTRVYSWMQLDLDEAHRARVAGDMDLYSFWNEAYYLDWQLANNLGC